MKNSIKIYIQPSTNENNDNILNKSWKNSNYGKNGIEHNLMQPSIQQITVLKNPKNILHVYRGKNPKELKFKLIEKNEYKYKMCFIQFEEKFSILI